MELQMLQQTKITNQKFWSRLIICKEATVFFWNKWCGQVAEFYFILGLQTLKFYL